MSDEEILKDIMEEHKNCKPTSCFSEHCRIYDEAKERLDLIKESRQQTIEEVEKIIRKKIRRIEEERAKERDAGEEVIFAIGHIGCLENMIGELNKLKEMKG